MIIAIWVVLILLVVYLEWRVTSIVLALRQINQNQLILKATLIKLTEEVEELKEEGEEE